jgi:hypothetical protein
MMVMGRSGQSADAGAASAQASNAAANAAVLLR